MSDDILKTLLETLTEEQKAKLVASLTDDDIVEDERAPEPAPEPSPPKKRKTVVNSDFTVVRDSSYQDAGKRPVKAGKNQWSDIGEDRDEDFDPEMYEKLGKAARRKSGPKKVKVECHVCGKSFSAHAGNIYGEYVRCNRCTGR